MVSRDCLRSTFDSRDFVFDRHPLRTEDLWVRLALVLDQEGCGLDANCLLLRSGLGTRGMYYGYLCDGWYTHLQKACSTARLHSTIDSTADLEILRRCSRRFD